MKKVIYSLSALIIIVILAISVALFYNFSEPIVSSPTPANLESCNVLQSNGDDKINIVFLSSEDNAIKFSEYLFMIEPFKSSRDSFNVFNVDAEPSCELYKGIALYCYSKNNIKLSSSCPNDFIIAVSERESNIRSSTYMNFLSINSVHPSTVAAHEFSHALANLADEYVPASLPRGSVNCARSCDSFTVSAGDSSADSADGADNADNTDNGCFEGCSLNNYFRSIDTGIMRSLFSNQFGSFNEKIINSQISYLTGKEKKSLITGNVIEDFADCSSDSYYLIEGTYIDNILTITDKSVESGCVGRNGAGTFTYELTLDSGDKHTSGDFNPELIFTESQPEGADEITGEHFANEGSFYLKIPKVENAKSLIIKNDNIALAEVILNEEDAVFCEV